MTPQEELKKIQTENFAGGTYYGRTPNGIVDLRTNQVVPSSAQYGTTSPANKIASSTVRRYSGTYTAPTGPNFKGTADDYFGNLDITPPTEDEVAKIKDEQLSAVQRELDAIDASTATLLAAESRRGENRLGQSRAISARSGVLGSDFGERRRQGTEDVNKRAEESIVAAQEAKKVAVLDKAQQRAADIAAARSNEALTNAGNFLTYMKQKQEEARADLKTLAGAGIDINTLTQNQYDELVSQSGYEPVIFDAVYNANLPANAQRKYHYENLGNGRVVRFDEAGGQPSYFDYSVPDGYTFKMAGDIPVFVNEKTQDIKIANASNAADGQTFGKETELDTFTDASGNRVSVMYNPVTKKTRQITLGKAGGGEGGSFPTGFKPQSFEVSAVQQFIASEGAKQGQSKEEIDSALSQATRDSGFFYSILGAILNDENYSKQYYKPVTLGIPTTVQLGN